MTTNSKWIGSPHFHTGRSGYRPKAVVIHIAEGDRVSVDSWFKNPESMVSAHYLVCLDGTIHQYVREEDVAYHAGRVNKPTWKGLIVGVNPNRYTIGIEHEGHTGKPFTPTMMDASLRLVHDITTRWAIPVDRDHIIGHCEIYSLKPFCPGIDLDDYVQRLRSY